MRCLVIINQTISNQEYFNSVLKIIIDYGGKVSGSYEKGVLEIKTIYGRFEANFIIKNNNLQLVITEKPLIIPSTMLKNKILNFFSNCNVETMIPIFNKNESLV